MKKFSELISISKSVKLALEVAPETRSNDDLLYLYVCNMINPSVMIQPFHAVLAQRKSLNLPTFETVRRARQKIQAKFPDLSGNEECIKARKELEAEFREFARCDNG